MSTKPWLIVGVLVTAAGWSPTTHADSVTLAPTKDNTLIENATGAVSNGAGGFLFCGRTRGITGGIRLRPVLAFNVAGSIPAGSTITAATLTLNLSMSTTTGQVLTLHRLTADWGEGTSNTFLGNGAPSTPNDATWIHTFYSTQFWTTPGGDFIAAASASQTVNVAPPAVDYTWSGAQMVSDVQGWLSNPAANFGWLLLGPEAATGVAKRFASREDQNAYPRLTVTYTLPSPCIADIDHNSTVNVNDLLAVVSTWGPCPAPCPPHCPADIAPAGGNCVIDVNDLLAVVSTWGPCP